MRLVLVVIGGLPATGKSTIAGALATETATPYLRVDRIEEAIVVSSSLSHPLGPVGYAVAYQLAIEQLWSGLDVIVECVNPLAITRDAWPDTAANAGAAIVEVEIICSDQTEHRRRVETRALDVDGLVKPTWAEVIDREYEPWRRAPVRIDSATTPWRAQCSRLSRKCELSAKHRFHRQTERTLKMGARPGPHTDPLRDRSTVIPADAAGRPPSVSADEPDREWAHRHERAHVPRLPYSGFAQTATNARPLSPARTSRGLDRNRHEDSRPKRHRLAIHDHPTGAGNDEAEILYAVIAVIVTHGLGPRR
jgi:predicted kinase